MSYETYTRVREAFERRGRTMEMWCLDNGENRSVARNALVYGADSRREREVRERVMRAAGLEPSRC